MGTLKSRKSTKGFIILKEIALIHLLLALIVEGSYQLGSDNQRHFIGYAVLRMVPTDENELKVLKSLAQNEENELDFWKPPTRVNEAVDVMVPPEKILHLEQLLIANTIPRTVLLYDVERYVMKERLDMSTPSILTGRDSDSFFTNYRSLKEIHNFVDELAEGNPKIAQILTIGKSSDKNDLKVIKIGDTTTNSSKPAIWIDGGIHSREWISPATVTYIASRLVQGYNTDQEVKQLVDRFDWYILPIVNPDGYEYSREINRMWRKTRRSHPNNFWGCRGVDLNRNWGFHWREGGSSTNPCSDTYAGATSFSEPETKAVSQFVLDKKENFVAFLNVHSYSQLWLTPWGWTSQLPKDYDAMVTVAQEATNALAQLYGTHYRIGSSTNILYEATGGADDWAYGFAGIKYSYTLELRDTGRYGFLLPAEQILPTGQETWAGIKAMATAINRELL